MSFIIPSTSRTTMQMTTPPVGWTKDTSYNEYTLRVQTGSVTSGGTVNFTTAFTSYTTQPVSSSISLGATTINNQMLPSHTHSRNWNNPPVSVGIRPARGSPIAYSSTVRSPVFTVPATIHGSTGGGGSHTHPIGTIAATQISGGLDFRLSYVDIILVTRD